MSSAVVVLGQFGGAVAVDSSAYTLTPTGAGCTVVPDPVGARRKVVRSGERVAAIAGVSSWGGVYLIDIVSDVIADTAELDDIPDALLTAAQPVLVPAYQAWAATPAGAAAPDSAFLELIVLGNKNGRPEALTLHTNTRHGGLTLVGDVYWAHNQDAVVEAIGVTTADLFGRTQRGRLTASVRRGRYYRASRRYLTREPAPHADRSQPSFCSPLWTPRLHRRQGGRKGARS